MATWRHPLLLYYEVARCVLNDIPLPRYLAYQKTREAMLKEGFLREDEHGLWLTHSWFAFHRSEGCTS
jgi:hypothetical protein